MSTTVEAILWVLLGTFAFSLILALGRLLGVGSSVPALQIVLLRYVGGLITMLILVGMGRSPRRRWPGLSGLQGHVFRAVCGSAGVVCSLYAATRMPFADATAIGLTQGMLVVALAAVFLRERVTAVQWAAGGACALGAAVVVFGRSGFHLPSPDYLWPSMIGLAGALLVAGEIVLIRTLAVRDSATTVLLYVNLLASLLLVGPAMMVWHPVHAVECLELLLLGPLAIAAQYFNIRAFRIASASLLGPIGYSRLLFAALLGFALFGESPPATTWIGGAIMIGSGLVLARSHGEKRKS